MAISASAPTYLRQYSDLYAAGAIEEGLCDQMLFGRLSFADPDFPNQIRDTGRIDPKKVCVTCGKCGKEQASVFFCDACFFIHKADIRASNQNKI